MSTFSCLAAGQNPLRFDPDRFTIDSITMPRGEVVRFKAYAGLYYVRNIEDSAYQRLNIYVPLDLKGRPDADIWERPMPPMRSTPPFATVLSPASITPTWSTNGSMAVPMPACAISTRARWRCRPSSPLSVRHISTRWTSETRRDSPLLPATIWTISRRAATPENRVFGDTSGTPSNFTDFSLRKRTGDATAELPSDLEKRVALMNPMGFIRQGSSGIAPHWYIRHGAKDRDTSFLVPVNLATRLRNCGYDVDFALPWNRPHSGDYNLDDLFRWIESVK